MVAPILKLRPDTRIAFPDEKVKNSAPFDVTWGGIAEEEPRYIRDLSFGAGVILPIVTTPALRRGYLARGANDYLLCKIDGLRDAAEAILTLVGIQRTIEGADAWIKEDDE